ncbi:hypothetical protein M438DRAFT_308423 [Aureobasidium pullulans EXF-150]|uniref:Uncharacterized protein n=1 Tax=Aureobasidium pullulans EXF-150 TaxID=1043002 RepID=A0A074YQU1_AURPU|nr:uncharacterized protein M438DRAFT_308423 [Aureobasidium pullulans EXF-150]KEQ89211.1 hypothetical protein M438DRAFT_308423 [Aureobasidium pullulans EXF-150]
MASHGHLAHGVLQILVNLQGDGQDLGIASLLRTKTLEGVENPIFFIAFVISKGIINYTIKHILLHTVGTLMVSHYFQDHRLTLRSQSQRRHSFLDFLRNAISSPRRLRRDLTLGIAYNTMYTILNTSLQSISSNTVWTLSSHLVTATLLLSFHLRWTAIIVSSKPLGLCVPKRPQKDLIIPVIAYTCAQELAENAPKWLYGLMLTAHGGNLESMRVIAAGDTVVLVLGLTSRMLVLYPAYAAYVYSELLHLRKRTASLQLKGTDGFGDAAVQGEGDNSYGSVLSRCWKRLAVRLGVLHLQTAFLLVVVECIAFAVLHRVLKI